jgi:hypothetical protein
MKFKKMKHNSMKAAKVAAVLVALKFSGCGVVLDKRLVGVKKREICYCDMCGAQKIHDKHRASELFSPKNSVVEVTDNDGNVVWGIKEFEIKNKEIFLDFLQKNYERLPKKLFEAEKIIVRGNVAGRASNGEIFEDPLESQQRFVALRGDYVVQLNYKTGKRWKTVSIPISTCLNNFFFGNKVFESRKQLIEDGVINPEKECVK